MTSRKSLLLPKEISCGQNFSFRLNWLRIEMTEIWSPSYLELQLSSQLQIYNVGSWAFQIQKPEHPPPPLTSLVNDSSKRINYNLNITKIRQLFWVFASSIGNTDFHSWFLRPRYDTPYWISLIQQILSLKTRVQSKHFMKYSEKSFHQTTIDINR